MFVLKFSSVKLGEQIGLLMWRTGRRWSVREIAKAAGLSPAYLTFLRNGSRTNPSEDTVGKLCKFFRIERDELLEPFQHGESDGAGTEQEQIPFAKRTLNFCKELLHANNPDQVVELLSLWEDSFDDAEMPEVYQEKQVMTVQAFIQQGEFDKAAELLEFCLQHPLSEMMQARVLLVRGHIRHHCEGPQTAVKDYLEALELADGKEDRELLYSLHQWLAAGYRELEEYGLAIYHLEHTLRLFPAEGRLNQKVEHCLQLGQIQLHVRSYEGALQAFRRAESCMEALGDEKKYTTLLYWKAKARIGMHQFEKAAELLQEGLRRQQMEGDPTGVAAFMIELTSCFQKMERWEDMEYYARRAAISYENINEYGEAARAKMLHIKALMHLQKDPAMLEEMLDPVCAVFHTSNWHHELAIAWGIKADLNRLKGKSTEALHISFRALKIYEEYRWSATE